MRLFFHCLVVSLAFFACHQEPPTKNTSAIAESDIRVYLTESCPHCARLERYLKKEGVVYQRIDIERDKKGAIEFREYGGTGVPVTVVGKEVIHGFNRLKIKRALLEYILRNRDSAP